VIQIPLFVLALLIVRGLPAALYRRQLGGRRTLAAAFLQATSLPFIVAAAEIGERLGALSPASSAALVAAGLVSVLVFPAVALALLGTASPTAESDEQRVSTA
jgi:Kef-type K+ transport system membrane component KefB